MMNLELCSELLGNNIRLFTTKQHRPVTDAVLLADFARVSPRDIVCDMCAGCGVVSAVIYSRGINPAQLYAVEIDHTAVQLLEQFKNCNNVEGFVPINTDLRELGRHLPPNLLDCIVVNPPYFKEGSGHLPEGEARTTARYENTCTLDDIAKIAKKHLKNRGRLVMCHRPQRLAEIIATFNSFGIQTKRLRMVHKLPTVPPWLVLVEGQKSAKQGLEILPPLITRNLDGSDSKELMEIYAKGRANFIDNTDA